MADIEKLGMVVLILLVVINMGTMAFEVGNSNNNLSFNGFSENLDYNKITSDFQQTWPKMDDGVTDCPTYAPCKTGWFSQATESISLGIGSFINLFSINVAYLYYSLFGYSEVMNHIADLITCGDVVPCNNDFDGVHILFRSISVIFTIIALFGIIALVKFFASLVRG